MNICRDSAREVLMEANPLLFRDLACVFLSAIAGA
jgi:hypothetical protein